MVAGHLDYLRNRRQIRRNEAAKWANLNEPMQKTMSTHRTRYSTGSWRNPAKSPWIKHYRWKTS